MGPRPLRLWLLPKLTLGRLSAVPSGLLLEAMDLAEVVTHFHAVPLFIGSEPAPQISAGTHTVTGWLSLLLAPLTHPAMTCPGQRAH